MMGEDSHLEAQYEDRHAIPEDDLEETQDICSGCDLPELDCECVCDRCGNPLSDGEYEWIENKRICWVCDEETPDEEDLLIEDATNGVSIYGHKFLGYHPSPRRFCREWRDQHNFWPDVWVLDDHGGYTNVSADLED